MPIYVASGHNVASLVPLAVDLRIERQLDYQRETSADGIERNIGGGFATLSGEALDYDEAILVLNQFGVSTTVPSALCTVALPDRHRLTIPFYGVVSLDAPTSNAGWWTDFRLQFTGLREVT